MNKNSSYIVLLLIISICAKLNAQSSWNLLNPKPSYQNCLDIEFVSSTNGFIINETQLLKTIDAGVTWEILQPLTYARDIAIKNSIGYIVELTGNVYKTIDNGQTWNLINTTFAYAYTKVNIIDDNNIILSSNNKIVKTTNGGATWTSISVTGFPSITKTFFTSSLVGHAICSGKILKTINGGTSWYVTNSINTSASTYYDITFVNENVGYASREFDVVLKTTDGGENWNAVTSPQDGINRFYFLNETQGYGVCDDGFMFKTNNGGSTWTSIAYRAGYDYAGYFGVYFQDTNTGYVVGERGRIAKTTDGGLNWNEYSPTYDDIIKSTFVNESVGYSLIPIYSKILKTTDGGNNWQIVGSLSPNSNPLPYANDFCFVNENIGFATVSDHGRIFKTTDGGINWTATNSQILNDGYNSKVFFFDENIGFASGGFNSPRTCKTVNGGVTWQTIANLSYTKIQFLTPQIAFGIYGNGLYKTTDGGTTWSQITTAVNSYYFLNENIGFTINTNTLKKTTNGGVTWQSTALTNTGTYAGLKFVDEQLGYVMKDNISIYRTTNGGQSWSSLVGFYGMNHFNLLGAKIYASGVGGVIQSSVIPASLLDNSNFERQTDISIYPNPASEYLNIVSEKFFIKSVIIYNLLGREIMNIPIADDNLIAIDISNLNKGIYLIKVFDNNNSFITKKLLVK